MKMAIDEILSAPLRETYYIVYSFYRNGAARPRIERFIDQRRLGYRIE
jgi:hypothetical protein